MASKIELQVKKHKILLLTVSIFVTICITFVYSAKIFAQDSQNIPTVVTVGNNAPTITVDPTEEDNDSGDNRPSSSTQPTNEDDDVDFYATGTDLDGDQYYLAICKEAGGGGAPGITAGDDTFPTCGNGNWCVSGATNSTTEATCSYTTLNTDANSNVWYAYVCDKVSGGGECSAASQGTGDSGSPFYVNHKATFTDLADDSATYDPGDLITWTSTSSDADTHDDDLYLLVCKTSGISQTTPYSAPACDGGAGDTYALSAGAEILKANSQAHYTLLDPNPAGNFTAYGYIYDEYYLLSSTSATTEDYTVNNIAPIATIGSVPGAITLTEGTTTAKSVTVSISDDNGFADVSTGGSVALKFYGNWGGRTEANCTATDGDDCYVVANCTYNGDGSGKTATFTCSLAVQYYAEATGVGSQHTTDNWVSYILVTDSGSNTDSDSDATSTIGLLVAFSSTASLNYGVVDPGDSSSTNETLTITGTGNTIIDTTLYGTDLTRDGGGGTITVGNQEYDDITFSHNSGTDLLVNPGAELELNVPKTYYSGTIQIGTADIYWSIFIPLLTPRGDYSGTNTVVAVQGEW